jgi:uncharacterized protein (TIGR00299 family) protein
MAHGDAHHHSHSHDHAHDDGDGHIHPRGGPRNPGLPRGAGRGKLLFLDAFSGIAGDMFVAALLDLGVPRAPIDEALAALPLAGYRARTFDVSRSGIVATRFEVDVERGQPQRTYAAIRAMVEAAPLTEGARNLALRAFRILGEAEADVHRIPIEEVHFHEVGAVDSIVDTVAVAVALDWLGAEVVAAPLPMGRGFVRAQHGILPVPAPATVLSLRGVPTIDDPSGFELVTPTGACLVAAAARSFARWPAMRPERVGWGAGKRELADRPNLLRVVLGVPDDAATRDAGRSETATHTVLEANVDDMTGELAAHVIERALAHGALDAWATPIVMKKGRPALKLSALARRADAGAVARALLAESTTLGVRASDVRRTERPRRFVAVDTRFGSIPIKVADGDGLPAHAAPEHDACRAAANAHGVPLRTVYAAALAALSATEKG